MSLLSDIKFDPEHQLAIQTINAELAEIFVQTRIPRIELERREDVMGFQRDVIIRMARKIAHIPGKERVTIPRIEVPEIKVPATWWDSFKETHFDVLLRWFPVRYRVLQFKHVMQYEQTYEARWYLPNLEIPERYAGPVELKLFEPLTRYE